MLNFFFFKILAEKTKQKTNCELGRIWKQLTNVRSEMSSVVMYVCQYVCVFESLCDNLNGLLGLGQSVCYFTTWWELTPTLNEHLLYTRVLTLQLLWLASCAFQGWIHVVPCHHLYIFRPALVWNWFSTEHIQENKDSLDASQPP